MSLLEHQKYGLQSQEHIAADSRFFYAPESENESYFARVINFTNAFLEYYKLPELEDLTVVQLRKQGTFFTPIVVAEQGETVSLLLNCSALKKPKKPLWELSIALDGSRAVHQVNLSEGLHSLSKHYDRQGKLRSITTETADIHSVWEAVETMLQDSLTHDHVSKIIAPKHSKHPGAILIGDTSGSDVSGESDAEFGQPPLFEVPPTPAEAKEALAEMFDTVNFEQSLKLYQAGLFHISVRHRTDTPEAQFYILVETLTELAVEVHNTSPVGS
ncbi:hypothetical protein KBD20_03140 [Candidatus Saccharibacteria bacterium]|nr:hypothetical protein [Candidatus Saccharibacteria bacterium]